MSIGFNYYELAIKEYYCSLWGRNFHSIRRVLFLSLQACFVNNPLLFLEYPQEKLSLLSAKAYLWTQVWKWNVNRLKFHCSVYRFNYRIFLHAYFCFLEQYVISQWKAYLTLCWEVNGYVSFWRNTSLCGISTSAMLRSVGFGYFCKCCNSFPWVAKTMLWSSVLHETHNLCQAETEPGRRCGEEEIPSFIAPPSPESTEIVQMSTKLNQFLTLSILNLKIYMLVSQPTACPTTSCSRSFAVGLTERSQMLRTWQISQPKHLHRLLGWSVRDLRWQAWPPVAVSVSSHTHILKSHSSYSCSRLPPQRSWV